MTPRMNSRLLTMVCETLHHLPTSPTSSPPTLPLAHSVPGTRQAHSYPRAFALAVGRMLFPRRSLHAWPLYHSGLGSVSSQRGMPDHGDRRTLTGQPLDSLLSSPDLFPSQLLELRALSCLVCSIYTYHKTRHKGRRFVRTGHPQPVAQTCCIYQVIYTCVK